MLFNLNCHLIRTFEGVNLIATNHAHEDRAGRRLCAKRRPERSDAPCLLAFCVIILLWVPNVLGQPFGDVTYADSADFVLNATGFSVIVGGATSADSGDFALATRQVLVVTTLADNGAGSLRAVLGAAMP